MIEGRDFIFFSTLDFGRVHGSREAYAVRLAKRNRVFFVNPHYGPEHLLRRPWIRSYRRGCGVGCRAVGENLWVITPPLALPGRRYLGAVDRANQARLAAFTRRALAPFGVTDPILWIYLPWSDHLPGRLGESVSLYFCIDPHWETLSGRARRRILDAQRRLMERVDFTVAITRHLMEALLPHASAERPLRYLPNGAETERILEELARPTPLPGEIEAIPEPRLGFLGTLNAKVDLDLVLSVARRRPDWHWVFLGMVQTEEIPRRLRDALDGAGNIHLLGPRPRERLVAYERGFTISTIPLLLNSWTRYVRPLKFCEYLALGRPIVSTPLPELAPERELVHFAEGEEAWVAEIEAILAGRSKASPERLREAARNFSWTSRLEQISAWIREAGAFS